MKNIKSKLFTNKQRNSFKLVWFNNQTIQTKYFKSKKSALKFLETI